ncbi:RraA family protein [Priestia megaterium]|uniref:RraA family protein n=1 Tax=Priestia megaterium TaxID=1404 RepID=UPI00366E81F9
MQKVRLSKSELLKLQKLNTPTVYNGWEQITDSDIAKENFNSYPVIDFMPNLGSMVGYAITLVIQPSNKELKKEKAERLKRYREYVASVPGPKIVIVKDLDKQHIGSFWGEVNSTIHRALGCVGTIVDGAVRDIDEMENRHFKAIAKQLCIGHAHVTPLDWNCNINVFGCEIKPGQLIHADKHGFLAIPTEDEQRLLEAATFMDNNEFDTVIPAAWGTEGISYNEILKDIERGSKQFKEYVKRHFNREGEW